MVTMLTLKTPALVLQRHTPNFVQPVVIINCMVFLNPTKTQPLSLLLQKG